MGNKLPSIVSDIPSDLRNFLDRVRESLETLTSGSGGSGTTGGVGGTGSSGTGSGSGSAGGLLQPCGATQYPTAPTGLEVAGAFTNIMLDWDAAPYCGHAFTEIWAARVERNKDGKWTTTSLDKAKYVGQTEGNVYAHAVEEGSGYYYWIRHVNVDGIRGPFDSVAGTFGFTERSPAYLLELLTGEITESQLYKDLGARIGLIDGPSDLSGSVNARVATVKADVDAVGAIANLKTRTYYAAAEPKDTVDTPLTIGDLWIDSDDSNTLYRWNGKKWVSVADKRVAKLVTYSEDETTERISGDEAEARRTQSLYAASYAGIGNSYKYFTQPGRPVSSPTVTIALGDVWVWEAKDATESVFKRYTGSMWVDSSSNRRAAAFLGRFVDPPAKAPSALGLGNPALVVGDAYLNTSTVGAGYGKTFVYNGTKWVEPNEVTPPLAAALVGREELARVDGDKAEARRTQSLYAATNAASGTTYKTFVQEKEPLSASLGDVWVWDAADATKSVFKRHNGTAKTATNSPWVDSSHDKRAAKDWGPRAKAPDTNRVIGDTYLDTGEDATKNGKTYTWNGSQWVVTAPKVLQALITTEERARTSAVEAEAYRLDSLYAGATSTIGTTYRTFIQSQAPTGAALGDVWVWKKNGVFRRYNGAAWVDSANQRAAKFLGAVETPPTTGDLVIGDTCLQGTKNRVWNGTQWIDATAFKVLSAAIASEERARVKAGEAEASRVDSIYAASTATVGTTYQTFVQKDRPLGTLGDVWVWKADGIFRRHNGVEWVNSANNTRAAKYHGECAAAPSGDVVIGDVYLHQNTANPLKHGKLFVYTGIVGALWSERSAGPSLDRAWVGQERRARLDAESAAAKRLEVVQADLNDNTARIAELDTALVGVCSIKGKNGANYTTREACEKAGGTWRLTPMATAVKQVAVTIPGACYIKGNKDAAKTTKADCEAAGGVWVAETTTAIEQRMQSSAEADGKLRSQYTVKLDTDGYVSGFGLASTGVNGAATTDFAVRADRFYIAAPSSKNLKNPKRLPFVVQATNVTINGEVIDPGVYIDSAWIQNGTIGRAKIANAAIDDAKIANLTANKITSGSITVGTTISSSNFESGNKGWQIKGNGDARFENAYVRGTIEATNGTFFGKILGGDATDYSTGTGFFSGPGGKWRVGDPKGARIQWNGTAVEVYNAKNELTLTSGGVQGLKAFAKLDKITADNVSTYIANAAIQTAHIDKLAVTNAKIADAAITRGKIADLAVDTLKIAGNAVTVPVGGSYSGAIPWVTVHMAHPGTLMVIANINIYRTGAGTGAGTLKGWTVCEKRVIGNTVSTQTSHEVGISLAEGFSGAVTVIGYYPVEAGTYRLTGNCSFSLTNFKRGVGGILVFGVKR